jgi:tetratricopeptide (TPR) repeat protein
LNIGESYIGLEKYKVAISYFEKGYTILKKGGFPFQIGKCYEALGNMDLALDYYIQSSEIRKVDPECGLEHENTQNSIENAKRVAKELGKENELPEWIK